MRIQHNIAAMNSYRNYVGNNSALSRNLEKLSSGYRINRAGDDAAGLAISEKMRAQISGLDQAQSNVKDGISLVKTAEGALQEVQDMMNRMVTLATQSANGTYQDAVDRENLQAEVDALKKEIDRIAESSNFNGQKLLNGDLAANVATSSVSVGVEGTELQDKVVSTSAKLTATTVAAANAKFEFTATTDTTANFNSYEISFTDNDGNSYTFNMVADAADTNSDTATIQATAIAGGLNAGTNFALSALGTTGDGGEAVAKFRELFTASTVGDKVVITAKDADSTATVDSVKQAVSTDAKSAKPAAGTAAAITATAASEAYDVYDITVANDTEYKITINDKDYTYTSDASATIDEIYAGLAKALKADGYEVELVDDATGKVDTVTATNNTAIKFTDPSQLKENQKGVQIVNTTSDKWEVDATVSAKGSTAITLGAPTENDVTAEFTVNYVNADNEAVTKTFEYNTGASATDAANNLVAAMKADKDFAAAFGITGATGVVTLAHNGSGTTFGVTSVSTTDKAGATVATTGSADTGKALTLASGKTLADGDQITIDGKTYEFVADTSKTVDDGVVKVALGTGASATADSMKNLAAALEKNGVKAEFKAAGTPRLVFADNKINVGESKEGGLTLQIGDTAESYNQLNVSIEDMHTKALGIADINIGNIKDAQAAIQTIKDAINKVSSTRGNLGAIQNRLEHTQNNLSVMTENIQDAESTIRDTDIADEMTSYTKNNILLQSAQAMLAQANQMPQGVLQLLQ